MSEQEGRTHARTATPGGPAATGRHGRVHVCMNLSPWCSITLWLLLIDSALVESGHGWPELGAPGRADTAHACMGRALRSWRHTVHQEMNCESATAERACSEKRLPPTAPATVMQYSCLIKTFAERSPIHPPDYMFAVPGIPVLMQSRKVNL